MKRQIQILMVCAFVLFSFSFANATSITVEVDAYLNSSSGSGSGLGTGISLADGQLFSVSAGDGDFWSAGTLPRWSDADGLIGDLLATGADESGAAAGTLIGQAFGNWTQNGLSAPYGSLVGEINGVFSLLGANFLGNAWSTGDLNLYYWDSNNYDNSETIMVTINDSPSPVPEPSTILLLGGGLLGLGWYGRKRRKS